MMNRQCRGVNYDGINCRMVEDEQVDLGRLVRSDGDDRRRSFDVYAQKICITGNILLLFYIYNII